MKQKIVKTAGMVAAMLIMHATTYGQELRTSLFDGVNRNMLAARYAQADVLSPKTFEAAMEAYSEAQKSYKNEGEIAKIKENIKKADSKFSEAIENAKVGSVMFSQALSARNDAMNAEAASLARRTGRKLKKP
ncbi:MAG: hypothetical protein RIE59_02435 [Imperialibacter sp.]